MMAVFLCSVVGERGSTPNHRIYFQILSNLVKSLPSLVASNEKVIMAKKSIRRPDSEDFEIMEDNKKAGTIRIKPSGILWKPKGKQSFFGVTVEEFAEFAEQNGKKQDK